MVGGGIAGSALGARLAREGVRVLILEKTTEFVDRVRGEAMLPWGVAELRRIGLYDVLIEAGGLHTQTWLQYIEGQSEAQPIPVGQFLPDSPPLNLGHPVACAALFRAAVQAGADTARGVTDIHLTIDPLGVSFAANGGNRSATAGLVVGADGRSSTVREQAGIQLERQDPANMVTGLLVEPATPLPDHDFLAVEGDFAMLSFLQPGGRARLYALPPVERRDRYTGRNGADTLLADTRLGCLPVGDALADGKPVGPCATFPGDETWSTEPFADGVVLIGDAAGHNNPIIGQGLSLAIRDARMVAEALLTSEGLTPEMFRPYAVERLERMRRVRFNANLFAALFVRFLGRPDESAAANMRRFSDPVLLQGAIAIFTGPETAPPEAFTDEAFEAVIGAPR